MAGKDSLAWLVYPLSDYGIHRIYAEVMRLQEDGEFHRCEWRWFDGEGREFADFRVTAYVGGYDLDGKLQYEGKIWATGYEFAPHAVDSADQAASMAKILRRVKAGFEKANERSGWLQSGDYHGHLLRVAHILRVPTVYVRNTPKAREISGEAYRKVNGSGLQSWLCEVERKSQEGKFRELLNIR